MDSNDFPLLYILWRKKYIIFFTCLIFGVFSGIYLLIKKKDTDKIQNLHYSSAQVYFFENSNFSGIESYVYYKLSSSELAENTAHDLTLKYRSDIKPLEMRLNGRLFSLKVISEKPNPNDIVNLLLEKMEEITLSLKPDRKMMYIISGPTSPLPLKENNSFLIKAVYTLIFGVFSGALISSVIILLIAKLKELFRESFYKQKS